MPAKKVAMIPARLGSQRLKKKNLQPFAGMTLIEYAISRCKESGVFDEIYVNSESELFAEYADRAGVKFYKRPEELGNNVSTSEEFVEDFLNQIHCEDLFQIHSITPLLTPIEIRDFVAFCSNNRQFDTVLSCIEDQIEVSLEGKPINFSLEQKTNSQDLTPTQRVTWSATKWSREVYLEAKSHGKIGTYSGNVGFYSVGPFSGLAIKTADDLKIATALKDAL